MERKCIILFVITALLPILYAKYEPNWTSIDSRPLPKWFDESKFGIFIHWGVYSVPSFGNEWFWHNLITDKQKSHIELMEKYYGKSFVYPDFASEFKAEFFNATEWAKLFVKAGAKYVVLTTKHHEGFALYPTKYSFGWNAMNVGPGRDLVAELADAVRKEGLIFGVYYSLFEWYNPVWLADQAAGFKTRNYVLNHAYPQLKEIINAYKPHLLFSDGDAAGEAYWGATEFLAWLYNESPVKDYIVVNDRWGWGTSCKHGGYLSCQDRFLPGTLQKRKFENAMTIDRWSWGWRRNAPLSDYYTPHQLITQMVQSISCGGNILMDVGPTKEGLIDPIFEDRLSAVGEWLGINGEAIYGTKVWTVQNDTHTGNVWYTTKDNNVYAISLAWPVGNTLVLESPLAIFKTIGVKVVLLGNNEQLQHTITDNKVHITLPNKAVVKSKEAYVLKISK